MPEGEKNLVRRFSPSIITLLEVFMNGTYTHFDRRTVTSTIVEVWKDATFHSFYHYFHQDGARRSTKRLIRTASRNEGVSWMRFEQLSPAGLETIAQRLEFYAQQSNPVVKKTLRIIKRRTYRRLISVSPDQLGLTKTQRLPIYAPVVRAS
jgi:hypothetical protein